MQEHIIPAELNSEGNLLKVTSLRAADYFTRLCRDMGDNEASCTTALQDHLTLSELTVLQNSLAHKCFGGSRT